MATAQQGLGDRSSEAPGSSVRARPHRTGGAVARPRRAGVTLASGLPWILPALVLCVGLIYYCIGYTGLISTWKWDGISPNPQHVGFGNYTQLFHDPLFWGAVRHTASFSSTLSPPRPSSVSLLRCFYARESGWLSSTK